MADKKATLHIEGQAPIELPITEGVLGTPVIDVRTLGSNSYILDLTKPRMGEVVDIKWRSGRDSNPRPPA